MSRVAYSKHQDVAVLTIDNPPVNAASQAVRSGLLEGIQRATADAEVRAIVLIGAAKTFVAGADIREFGAPQQPPLLHDVIRAIESSGKPIIAALHGTALGGGLELALACHYRIGVASVKLGLPEVNLGLLPGAGGTQRLTRLIGPRKALDMILSGKPVSGQEGLEHGILDELAGGNTPAELESKAIQFASQRACDGGTPPMARNRQDRIGEIGVDFFNEIREKNGRKWAGLLAQWKIVECVQAACEKSFEDGERVETASFNELRHSAQALALRYAFFAEREAAKIPDLPAEIIPATIASAAVIGAGTMGGGIAMCFANRGIPVWLLDSDQSLLDKGLERVRGNYSTSVSRGSMSQNQADRALNLIKPTTRYETIAEADIVIEAVFEDMQIKREVFQTLDRVMKPGAILATNTSTLDIDQIAAATGRPQDVIGTHFFSPANVMKLQENIRGRLSSARSIATVMQLAKQLGKVAVLAGNKDGFIGNRVLAVYGRECDFLLEEGATPWQIDRALQAFGFPMGLYLMRDMSGLDVGWRVRQYREQFRDKSLRYSPIADRICERGRLGQKTGAGYYLYDGRQARPDPEIERLIESISAELGIRRTPISDEDIVVRVLTAMANEGAKIAGEGIALRASDVDVTYLYGYGFPRHQGGPMYWAQAQGLPRVLDTVRHYHAEQGALWAPAPLLIERSASGRWKDA